MTSVTRASKICATCGRPFSWRKKWERNWDEIRYCSSACRGKKKRHAHGDLAELLMQMAQERFPKTLCPSEVARRYEQGRENQSEESWRQWMEPLRSAARLLVAAGRLEVLQKNQVVDAGSARGPIRIRWVR
jgi:hypothetical protein